MGTKHSSKDCAREPTSVVPADGLSRRVSHVQKRLARRMPLVPADGLSGSVTEHREHGCARCHQCQPTDCAGERLNVRERDTDEPDAVRTKHRTAQECPRVNYMQEEQLRENNQQNT